MFRETYLVPSTYENKHLLVKTLLLSLLLLLSALAAAVQAQPTAKDTTEAKRFYIGATATTMGYNVKYREEPKGGDIHTRGVLNMGYRLSKRARVQVGVSYGTANTYNDVVYVEAEDKLIFYDEVSRSRGIAVPITGEYILLYPFRRLQLYGTAMLTPVYSTTRVKKTERREEESTVTYDEQASGFSASLSAGFGLGYPVSKRLDAYFNYYMISRDFHRNLRRRDEYPYPGSLAIGLNYNFNLKREK